MKKYLIFNDTQLIVIFMTKFEVISPKPFSSFATGSGSSTIRGLKLECRYPTDVNGLNTDISVASDSTGSGNGSSQGSLKYEMDTTVSDVDGRTLITIKPKHDLDINLT